MIAQLEEIPNVETASAPSTPASRRSAAAYLLSGTSALGAGVVIERGLGFLVGVGMSIATAILTIVQSQQPDAALLLTGTSVLVFLIGLGLICWLGHRHRWLSNRSFLAAQLGAKLTFFNRCHLERSHA